MVCCTSQRAAPILFHSKIKLRIIYTADKRTFFFFLSMKKKTIRLTRVRIDIIVERTIRNAGVHHVPADEGVCLHFRSVRIRFSTEIFVSFMI